MRLTSAALLVIGLAVGIGASPAAFAATRLIGRVVDSETQAPIAGASIELSNASGGPGYHRTRSSANGAFEIHDIAADRSYTLAVSASGYADFVLGYWQIPSAQRGADVAIPLDRAGSIVVRVIRPDGKTPVAGVRVTARTETPSPWWRGQRDEPATGFSDARGVVRFVDLKAGRWTVIAEGAGLLTAEARNVSVRRGEDTVLPLQLVRPASLSGVVRLPDGTPVADVAVVARGPAEGVGTTGPDGLFTVGDLRPGKYRVEVQHEGFEPARSAETYAIAEGDARGGVVLTVTPRAAELAFMLPREVFATDEPVQIAMRSFRLGVVDLSLHRIPVARLLDPTRDFRALAECCDTTGLVRIRSWSHATPEGAPYAWREEMLAVTRAVATGAGRMREDRVVPASRDPGRGPGADVTPFGDLTPGVYLLRATGGGLERRQIFFVSDLSLLVKRSATKLLVSAASIGTGVPAESVAVSWLALGRSQPRTQPGLGWTEGLGRAQSAGVTNVEGLLVTPVERASQAVRVVAMSERLGVAVAESPLAPPVDRGGDLLYLYTERPIYRPGQTVYWKAFARKAEGEGFTVPAVSDVRLELRGPDGSMLAVPPARLSSRGSADGSVAIPAGVALGEYVLQATAGRTSGTASIAIEEYRKPEFTVEVTPDREVVVSGDEVRFQIAASYFFGAPVFGALVRYNLFESRLDRDERGFDEEFGEIPEVGFGRVLKTGETRTDIDGRTVLTFTPERVSYDRRLTLEVEVVDAANRQVRGRGSVIVGRAQFRVTVRPLNRLVMAGDPVRVEVLTRDHLGKPVKAAVQVTLEQDSWNPIERRYTRSTRALASAVVITDTSGRGSASLTPEPARSGNLAVRARAQDAKNNVVTDEATVWIHDRRVWQYAYRYPTLEAFADRERYQPGDTARIVVNTDVGYASVLATLEGQELMDQKVVSLFGNTGLVSFPIRREQTPNAYVAIHVRKGKEILTRVLDLEVSAERRDLQIRLSPDRAEYRPQDEAKVGIETRDPAGAPVSAEVSLGVVDEAIYSLRADATPRAHEYFYGHRPNWVSTVVAFPAIYLGGASKTDRDVRRDFRDVAFWAPTVITGPDGRGEASFRFPDNLTTWRLTSRGATLDTRVGETVAKVLVTKDLVARLATPRGFVAGDRASLVSIVTNRTPQALARVDESIEVRGAASVRGPKENRTSIPARGESPHAWSIETAHDPGEADSVEAVFTYRAQSANDRDALELRVPVRPPAVPLYPRGSAVVAEARADIPIPLPTNLVRSGSEVRVDLSPSPAAMALAATDALAGYPWGCTEQTANVVRPAVALLAALPEGALLPPGWEDPERRLAPYLNRLVALQNQEGGWGWWEGGDSDPYMTLLAVNALARAAARDLGGDRVRSAIARASYPLQRALGEALTLDGQAYALAHLTSVVQTLSDQGHSDLRGRLEDIALLVYSSRDRLSVAGLALATRAHADLKRTAETRALMTLLNARAESEGGTHWPAALDETRWFGEAEENTGYALSALLAVDPRDPRIDGIVQWLARRRTGRFWRSTRTTAPVAIALAEYLGKRPAETRPDYRLTVQWNGEQVLDRAVNSADLFASAMAARIPGRSMRAGMNNLVVSKRGAGSVNVAWEATVMVPSPGPAPPGPPLTLGRTYLRAERTSDRRGRPQYLSSPLDPGRTFAVGDLVMVRLALNASRPLDHVMIQDPRPAGFEVDALTPEGVERPWDVHAEERDDRIAFFLDHVEAGLTVIEYLVRPELEGRLIALPTAASQMYEPEWIQRSAEGILEVKAK